MLSKAAFSNSNDVFSTIKIKFKRIVNIKVFEQKAEVNTLILCTCFTISCKVFIPLLVIKHWTPQAV